MRGMTRRSAGSSERSMSVQLPLARYLLFSFTSAAVQPGASAARASSGAPREHHGAGGSAAAAQGIVAKSGCVGNDAKVPPRRHRNQEGERRDRCHRLGYLAKAFQLKRPD
eukprot:4349167-Pleurochrysis_carterae.AAC.1